MFVSLGFFFLLEGHILGDEFSDLLPGYQGKDVKWGRELEASLFHMQTFHSSPVFCVTP